VTLYQRALRARPILILLGLWLLFFWRFFTPIPGDRLTYVNGDFTQQFVVFRDVVYRSLNAGQWPLWAECLNAGYPLHADPQTQLFYPPAWLTFGALRLMGWGNFPSEALVVEVAAHYCLTSLFLYLFLTSLKLRQPAALMGAVTFTYGGYLTGYPPLQTAVLEVNTWLPLALWLIHLFAERRHIRYLALAALTLAVAFFAGHPQTFVFVTLLAVAYLLFETRQAGWAWLRAFALSGALGVLLTALTAIQLLPSLNFILFNSTRAQVSFAEAAAGFPFQDLLQFFVTGLVSYWNPLYVGLLPLALAFFALRQRAPAILFWAAIAGASLIVSLGAKGIAYDVAYWFVPGLRLFRGSERLALSVSFSLAVLAAYGAHDFFGALKRDARTMARRLASVGLMVFGIALALTAGLLLMAELKIGDNPQRVLGAVALMLYTAGLTSGVLWMRGNFSTARRGLVWLGLGVIAIDLFAANRPLNVAPPLEQFPHTPLLDPVRAEALTFFRVQDDARLPGHAGCGYGFRALEGITPYKVASYDRFMANAPEPVRWRLLGVRYVFSWRSDFGAEANFEPSEIVAESAEKDAKGSSTKVLRLAFEPRRAFLVHQTQRVASEAELYAALRAPEFDPWQTALLAEAVETGSDASADEVRIESDAPGQLHLRVMTNAPAVLLISETYFPGWQAWVDGQPLTPLRADGVLLAVPLAAGTHAVELVYRPLPVLLGGVISILALLVTFGLVFIHSKL